MVLTKKSTNFTLKKDSCTLKIWAVNKDHKRIGKKLNINYTLDKGKETNKNCKDCENCENCENCEDCDKINCCKRESDDENKINTYSFLRFFVYKTLLSN